jgi:hypothetical protein
VVARMLGMTLGLAALSAWGVEYFQVLTAGLEFPAPMPGESADAVKDRLMEYDAELTAAGLSPCSTISFGWPLPCLWWRWHRRWL